MTEPPDEYPSVPHDRLRADGWELQSRREETVFRLPAMEVVGYTLVYTTIGTRDTDGSTGSAAEIIGPNAASGLFQDIFSDGFSRFFFATALTFHPPLPPGIGPASVRSIVATRARQAFRDDLAKRGFRRLEDAGTQRIRTATGDRARLRKFTARLPIDAGSIGVEGWLAVWVTDSSFRIAGGMYPTDGLELFSGVPAGTCPNADPKHFRDELLELIRSVQ